MNWLPWRSPSKRLLKAAEGMPQAMADGMRQSQERYSFQPGDRVKAAWDLATVLEVEPAQLPHRNRVLILWDEVDGVGWRRSRTERPPTWRLAYTLTKVPQDTPMHRENERSKAMWEGRGAYPRWTVRPPVITTRQEIPPPP